MVIQTIEELYGTPVKLLTINPSTAEPHGTMIRPSQLEDGEACTYKIWCDDVDENLFLYITSDFGDKIHNSAMYIVGDTVYFKHSKSSLVQDWRPAEENSVFLENLKRIKAMHELERVILKGEDEINSTSSTTKAN